MKKNDRSAEDGAPAIDDSAQNLTRDVTSTVSVVPIELNVPVANSVEARPHGHSPGAGTDRDGTPLCQPTSFAQYTCTARFPEGPSVTVIASSAFDTFLDTTDDRSNDATDRHFFVGFDVMFGLPTRI
ncbi:unannotated protein [freshwater metagenome]|uniref:Unannotated protein n=1 Tax=freshwater metagenome TaxID=449393 RepID=A0A6J7NTB7_9ZZZZ